MGVKTFLVGQSICAEDCNVALVIDSVRIGIAGHGEISLTQLERQRLHDVGNLLTRLLVVKATGISAGDGRHVIL